MGARQSNPGGGGGGAGGGCSATATTTSSRVQNESGLVDSGSGNNAGFAGLLSSSLCQNGSMSNRTRPIASSSGNTSGSGVSDWRQRARSLTNVINTSSAHHSHNANSNSNGQPFVTVSPLGHSSFGLSASPDSLTSIDDLTFGRVFSAHSLPVQLVPFNGIKCPVCSKSVLPDDVECHLVMCLTKPRISYNEDILTEDKGECVICLDDLSQGDTIARLPCLCIYHKCCIDAWFEVNRSCPEHPSD